MRLIPNTGRAFFSGRTFFCVVLATLALAAPARAAEPDHPLRGSITGERISKFDQFIGGCGVAVDAAGDVYVADHYQNRVAVFDDEWKYLTQITGINPPDPTGARPLDGPCDLAVDSAGRLYVNDYHRDVVRFTPAQYPPKGGTAYSGPVKIDEAHSTGVSVDPATDRVYVNDRTHVAVYEPSGEPVMEGGEPLRIGAGSLLDGYGVAISGFAGTAGTLYVADAATETIKVYEPAKDPEQPQFEIRGEGTDQGHFYLTDSDLAVDSLDGHLYVSQNLEPHFEFTPEAVVSEFSPEGFYRGPVPRSFANGFGSFLQAGEPSGLAIAGGELFVTSGNFEGAAVYIFGPPAPFVPQLLSVTRTGAGSVSSLPAGISCGSVCKAEFNNETNVTLKATPAPGSVFAGWSGCDSEPSPDRCAVRMEAAHAVSAEFSLQPSLSAAPLSAATRRSTTTERPPDERSNPDLGAAPRSCARHPRRRRGDPARPPARGHARRAGAKGAAARGCRAGGRLAGGRSLHH